MSRPEAGALAVPAGERLDLDVSSLLAWYRAVARDLPWRRVVTPYRTLVSELMLQQTRVETVVPYFERFVARWPDAAALAAAPIEEVLHAWAGLGYYRRARNLHAAARQVVAAGGFPQGVEGLGSLPGVGPYTAGAIASIAQGCDVPVVDGNVVRVLCRQLALPLPPAQATPRLWPVAAGLVPRGQAGDFNQALMELGATVCTPARPLCLLCPVRSSCAGVGDPERYPAPKPRAALPTVEAVVAVLTRGPEILLGRRSGQGLLGGLWEPLAGPGADAGAMLEARGVRPRGPLVETGRVEHVFTHLRLVAAVHVGEGEPEGEPAWAASSVFPAYDALGWRAPESVPLSTLARKWLRAAHTSGTPRAATRRSRAARPGRGSPASAGSAGG